MDIRWKEFQQRLGLHIDRQSRHLDAALAGTVRPLQLATGKGLKAGADAAAVGAGGLKAVAAAFGYRYVTTAASRFRFKAGNGAVYEATIPAGFLTDGASYATWPGAANEGSWLAHDYLYALHWTTQAAADKLLKSSAMDEAFRFDNAVKDWPAVAFKGSAARGAHFLLGGRVYSLRLKQHHGGVTIRWLAVDEQGAHTHIKASLVPPGFELPVKVSDGSSFPVLKKAKADVAAGAGAGAGADESKEAGAESGEPVQIVEVVQESSKSRSGAAAWHLGWGLLLVAVVGGIGIAYARSR